MRFLANGPNIPDPLLQKCDQGRVVFLCGAGVSLNADMPTFVELTKHVIEFFSPPDESPISTSFQPWLVDGYDGPLVPLDQIFHLLHQEYGRQDVSVVVAERLSRMNVAGVSHEHSLIARISSDPEGRPQIVTTNFDRLFDQCPGVTHDRIFEPPAFPDIEFGMPVHGVTYLHGRLLESQGAHHDYVLSSADFGRAYLAEGWATKFIRALLKTHTVVLVGYQAEDPPVKYLLQGLNHDGRSDASNLYALDKGAVEDIEAKWRDRGVTPIPYNDHPDLWATLEIWAERADNPRAWRNRVVEMARESPKALSAHERGQVAHVVRTTPGARHFAHVDPPPTAEWLCVFDASRRAGAESKGFGADAEEFDPLAAYGLDDDPERSSKANHVYDHLLSYRHGDTSPTTSHSLTARRPEGQEDMPSRLLHLMIWSAKHLCSPIAAWWVARQTRLHPRHFEMINHQLRLAKDLHPEARRTWNLILEAVSDRRNSGLSGGWYDFADKIEKEGWTTRTLRIFDDVMRPTLVCERPFGLNESKPPEESWKDITPEKIARWEVKFPDWHRNEPHIPEDVLPSVFRVAEGHLLRASGMLFEISKSYFRTPTCYPGREVEGEQRGREDDAYFRWFLSLMARMSEEHPAVLKAHVESWNHEDPFYFRKLKLFALNDSRLFSADEAVRYVLDLDQVDFWAPKVRRELLFLIEDRWPALSPDNRYALAERLLAGPDKTDDWSDEEYPRARDELVARYTRWLELRSLSLTEAQSERLKMIIDGIPDWSDSWTSGMLVELGPHIGSIRADDDPRSLLIAPTGEVVERARSESSRDYRAHIDTRPFHGLVTANPRKALAALSHSARREEYPEDLWRPLIQKWPEDASPRLRRTFLLRIARLPHRVMRDLSHTLGDLVKNDLKSIYKSDPELAWHVFDALLSGLVSDDGSAIDSGQGETQVGGEVVQTSRRTFDYAINGPIGCLTEGWLDALRSLGLPQAQGIPEDFATRLERLLAAPGEGGDHAVSMLSYQISCLHHLDPNWVIERLLPWFAFEHQLAEPAWNGFLSTAKLPSRDIAERLKPLLLDVFPTIYQWSWDHSLVEIAAQMIVDLAVFRRDQPDGLTVNETRQCLRMMSDSNRRDVIGHLGRVGQREEHGWATHVVPFVEQIWPRERKFRTTEMVSAWVNLLDDTKDAFPMVLRSIRRFLVPVRIESYSLYRFAREIGGEEPLTARHPQAVLELLDAIIVNDPAKTPIELADILEGIEAADPSLVHDGRYYRLVDLVENR